MIDAIPAPPPPVPVEAVVVRATRLPDPIGDAAFSVLRLGGETLRDAPRLDEALEQVPGLSLFRRNSSFSANPTTEGVSLRSIAGSGASRALVTLDGVPQNDPFGGWVIWSALPSEAIGDAQVVRGAGAGPYGAGALTGVIALSSRDLGPGRIAGEASGGSLGDVQGAAIAATALGPGVLTVSGAGERSDGYVPVRAGAGAADTRLSLEDWSGSARYVAPLGDAEGFARIAAFHDAHGSGELGAASRIDGGQIAIGLAQAPQGGRPGWQARAYVDHSDLANTSVSLNAGRSVATPANDQYATPATGFGANGLLRWVGGAGSLEVGADARGASGESRERFRYVSGAFTRLRFSGGAAYTGGLYVEGARTSGPWLITAGARLDGWAEVGAHRLEFDTASGAATLAQQSPDQGGVLPSGRLAVRRDLGDGLFARAAGYAGFRPATLNELDRPFRLGADVTEANPPLKPERLYGAEAGFGGNGALRWSATAFYNRLGDAVINATLRKGPFTDPVEGFIAGTLFQRRNVDHIDAAGVEADGERRLGPASLSLAADYTYARVDGGAAAPELTGKRPAQTPRLTVTGALAWQATARLSLTVRARWESARFDDDLNTRRLGPGGAGDLRADYAVSRRVGLFAEADNVTDVAVQTARAADGTISYGAPRLIRAGFVLRP